MKTLAFILSFAVAFLLYKESNFVGLALISSCMITIFLAILLQRLQLIYNKLKK